MKIAIIGSGGVGGYFGAKLALAGNDVTFLARGANLDALQKHGLSVKSILGDFHVPSVNATEHISEMGLSDLVILAVKAWQIPELAPMIKNIIGPDTVILPLQNGVLAAEELSAVLGNGPTVGGLCRIFSKIEAPGVIHHFGVEPTIVFGELDNTTSDRLGKIKEVFDAAGFASRITEDIQTDLWRKFILICVGGILALSKTNYGEVRVVPQTKELIRSLMEEIVAVSQMAGAHVELDYVDKQMQYIETYPAESTTSMARDIWEGKPSELDYQNGSVVKLGKRYGIDTPVNNFIYYCLLPMEMKARKLL